MGRYGGSTRGLLGSRGVLALFGVQMALFVVSFAAPTSNRKGAWVVMRPVVEGVHFVNSITDTLFAPGYNGLWDPLSTILVMPFVCYIVAVSLVGLGRAVSQRRRVAGQ